MLVHEVQGQFFPQETRVLEAIVQRKLFESVVLLAVHELFEVELEGLFLAGVIVGGIALEAHPSVGVGRAVNGHVAFHVGLAGLVGHEAVPVAHLRKVKADFMDDASPRG